MADNNQQAGNGNQTGNGSDVNENARQVQLVVATLIATVTFTAAFNMPGGYVGCGITNATNAGCGKTKAGGAVLWKQTFFQVFLATDMVAFLLSCSAALIRLFISFKRDKKMGRASKCGLLFTYYGMLCMMIAFVSGISAVSFASGTVFSHGTVRFFIFAVGVVIFVCGTIPISTFFY